MIKMIKVVSRPNLQKQNTEFVFELLRARRILKGNFDFVRSLPFTLILEAHRQPCKVRIHSICSKLTNAEL